MRVWDATMRKSYRARGEFRFLIISEYWLYILLFARKRCIIGKEISGMQTFRPYRDTQSRQKVLCKRFKVVLVRWEALAKKVAPHWFTYPWKTFSSLPATWPTSEWEVPYSKNNIGGHYVNSGGKQWLGSVYRDKRLKRKHPGHGQWWSYVWPSNEAKTNDSLYGRCACRNVLEFLTEELTHGKCS